MKCSAVILVVRGNDANDLNPCIFLQVTTIQKGGYFGELALVTHKPRAATVKAEGDVKVACKDIFRPLIRNLFVAFKSRILS